MKEQRTTIDIAAPPQRVWSIMSDVERWPEWTPSMRRITRLDKGPFQVGSRARVEQPKLVPSTWQVIELEENHGFAWDSSSPGVRAVGGHWIEPCSGGSRVTLCVQFYGLFGPLLYWALSGITARYLRMEAEGLKQRSLVV